MSNKTPPKDHSPEFISALDISLSDGSFIKLSLGHYKGAEADLKNIYARKVTIQSDEKLSLTYHYKTRDIVKNFTLQDGVAFIAECLQKDFYTGNLFTSNFDLAFENIKDRKHSIKKTAATAQNTVAAPDHNRQKQRLIKSEGSRYLHDLKVTDAKGNVFSNAQDKYRQINKYVEILSALIKNIPADKLGKVVDMGSGKGYLTFALYDYLHNTLGLKTRVTGVEYRPDMVDLCNNIAKKSGFNGLSFAQGSIDGFDASDANILIALHACDTATDDAIAKGIAAQAELIVVAPCCHKQIRREMEKNKADNDVAFLMKHGIFVERQAEMVTDGLRALILEYFGYTTKVFEFISDAHTPKNVLIVGTKNPQAPVKPHAILKKIQEAKAYFGITQHHLEKVLGL